jgi:hypothetical protein
VTPDELRSLTTRVDRCDSRGQTERDAFIDERLLLNDGASLAKVIDDLLDHVLRGRRACRHADDISIRQPLVVQIRELADQEGRGPGSRGNVSQSA